MLVFVCTERRERLVKLTKLCTERKILGICDYVRVKK